MSCVHACLLRRAFCYEVPVQYTGECEQEVTGGADDGKDDPIEPPPKPAPTKPDSNHTMDESCDGDVDEPVCGLDNVTYSSKCAAHLAVVLVAYPGECRCALPMRVYGWMVRGVCRQAHSPVCGKHKSTRIC